MTINAESILNSAEYFPLQFDGPDLVFVRMTRQNYHDSIFTMPGRVSPATNEQWKVPFAQVVGLVKNSRTDLPSASILLQIAHCGSTLLSRALDVPGRNLVIREPLVLRQLAASAMAASTEQKKLRQQGLRVLWYLLSRRFDENEPVLIKGNVPVNFMIPELLELEPTLNGVMLYSELGDYLVSILKSEQRQNWARYVTTELFAQIKNVLPDSLPLAESLTAAQAGTVLWHAQMQVYARALAANDRLKLLNSKRLFNQPEEALPGVNQYLQTALDEDQIQAQLASELFQQDAKKPEKAYSASQRERDVKLLIEQHHQEIEQSIEWSNSLNLGHGLDLATASHL